MMKDGTIIDATITSAPVPQRMQQKSAIPKCTRQEGNKWKFGMKCHIGVDAYSGLVHTMMVTPTNNHDVMLAANLLREDDGVENENRLYAMLACANLYTLAIAGRKLVAHW